MIKRFSKKRQAIIDCLKNTNEHPNAEWVYNRLKPEFPDLSIGTVYRNINELLEDGELVCVSVVNNKERYDAFTKPHTHAICSGCGKIIDVFDVSVPQNMIDDAQNITGFKIDYSKLQFVGLCDECSKK